MRKNVAIHPQYPCHFTIRQHLAPKVISRILLVTNMVRDTFKENHSDRIVRNISHKYAESNQRQKFPTADVDLIKTTFTYNLMLLVLSCKSLKLSID